MNNLAIIIEYFFKDKDVTEPFSSLTIRNDGEGEFISYWNDSALGSKPSDSELSAIESDALAWQAEKNKSNEISYYDFWRLLSFTKRVSARNLAHKLANDPDSPDFTLLMVYEETLGDSILDLGDADQKAQAIGLANILKGYSILTQDNVNDWLAGKSVS